MIPLEKRGYIEESGSNNYGEWVKFSDGTMICYREIEIEFDVSTLWGSLYVGENTTGWDFAQNFKTIPKVLVDIKNVGSSSLIPANYRAPIISTSSYRNIAVIRPTSNDQVTATVTIFAIGKWK